jgi:prevent-host-death family protein
MAASSKERVETIPAGRFKAQCLALLDDVNRTHREITITKRGKPVARLVPIGEAKQETAFGFLSGHVIGEGDIVSSTGERWEAEDG